jgi:predicted small secreted protein
MQSFLSAKGLRGQLALAMLLALLAFAGPMACNTMEGAGDDLENAGDEVEDMVD